MVCQYTSIVRNGIAYYTTGSLATLKIYTCYVQVNVFQFKTVLNKIHMYRHASQTLKSVQMFEYM